ncbi:MAG: uroporphyrinogen decarboxylase family protein [Planctomycetota bacterium]
MPSELARDAWRLRPLTPDECGSYGDFPRLSDAEKAAVRDAHAARRPRRVPVVLGTNSRVFLLDPRFDAEGLTYERMFHDPEALLISQLRWQYTLRCRHNVFCDAPTELPDCWEVGLDTQNVYEAAFFGAPVLFHDNSVPETVPFLAEENKRRIFDVDIERPLEHGFFRTALELWDRLRALAEGKTFLGRPIRVVPYTALGSDGPLTVAMNLRGPAILTDLLRDPDYARQLFDLIVTAGIRRIRAFLAHWNMPAPEQVWLADDSIAMLGPAQYREFLLPYHRKWYATLDPQRCRPRGIHLCGDATRHFRTIRDECGVTIFDTGFPVDFAALRRELGPDVELLGGPAVPLIMEGTPHQVYARARDILRSGVRAGGRFMLREGNNLPPGASWANLAAMYKAAFDCGAQP